MQSHTMQPHSMNSHSNLSLQASDDVDEEPIVLIPQRRPAAVETSPSTPAGIAQPRGPLGFLSSLKASSCDKRLLVVQSRPKSLVDLHLPILRSCKPPKWPPPQLLTIGEHYHTRIARGRRETILEKSLVSTNHFQGECIYIYARNTTHPRKEVIVLCPPQVSWLLRPRNTLSLQLNHRKTKEASPPVIRVMGEVFLRIVRIMRRWTVMGGVNKCF
jgi:hypothetical protein